MQIVTYLGFTILSIFIQFSVIDFIQGRLKVDDNKTEKEGVSYKRQFREVLKDVTPRPHALYYRFNKDTKIKNSPAKYISNTSLTEFLTTTDMTTTVFDVLYDENETSTENGFPTESLYTTTEIENFTEITFIEKRNGTEKTDIMETNKKNLDECSCNLLLDICDINCCCDNDCSSPEIKLFQNCLDYKKLRENKKDEEYCLSKHSYFEYINGLFCIAKVNLPENRNLVIKTDKVQTSHYLIWKSNEKSATTSEFSNSLYKYGDPVWLYKNGTIYHMDIPIRTVNSYCTGRKSVSFLENEKHKCNVRIQDLEMFQITKNLDEVFVISATPLSINTSVLNCTTLHCINWTALICENNVCTNYNKSVHDPICTESICTNLALKIEYTFYYQDFKITNASITFHVQNVTMDLPLISQEIEVKYVVGNTAIDRVVKLSGNPGYLNDLPIILSYTENNHTEAFYNSIQDSNRYFVLPENRNGICVLSNSSRNFLLYGRNRRINCRYNHKIVKFTNASQECKRIQNDINTFLNMSKEMLVSPFGNPRNLEDTDWVLIRKAEIQGLTYGQVSDKSSKLFCFNFISRYSLTFGYVNVNGKNRIVSATAGTTMKNVSFGIDDISNIITIDINFIDITKPHNFEYEYRKRNPSLNIHIPHDFFYPFRPNKSSKISYEVSAYILLCYVIISK